MAGFKDTKQRDEWRLVLFNIFADGLGKDGDDQVTIYPKSSRLKCVNERDNKVTNGMQCQ